MAMTRVEFKAIFDEVATAFQSPVDRPTFAVYYDRLKRYPVEAVVSTGRMLSSPPQKWFPKLPAWQEAADRYVRDLRVAKDNIPILTASERAEYSAAERGGWEREPCGCEECVEAGVSTRPQRYVPRDDVEAAWWDDQRDGEGNRMARKVTMGVWIHGYALARWYRARADLCEAAYRIIEQKKIA